jgi:hypothetical protein
MNEMPPTLPDLLRMGRLPEAWIAPPATRELRELVRHRAKLVGIRSNCKAQIHAVLAKCGIQVSMTDLFGLAGTDLLGRLELPKPYAARIASLRRIIGALDFESTRSPGRSGAGWPATPGSWRCNRFPVSVRSWGRCSWPRSVMCTGSRGRRS